jgi:hypothetical protein
MAFLGGLFKRKPGGTMLGNLIRGAANKASGGVLGNGSMMITQDQADLRDLTDADYVAKYGKTKTGVLMPKVVPNSNIYSVEQQKDIAAANALKNGVSAGSWGKFLDFLKTHALMVVLFVIALVTLIFYFVKKGGRRGRRR